MCRRGEKNSELSETSKRQLLEKIDKRFRHDIRTKLFLESTQNQRCFNVEFYQGINVDKSKLNKRGSHVERRRDVISTDINVESTG